MLNDYEMQRNAVDETFYDAVKIYLNRDQHQFL